MTIDSFFNAVSVQSGLSGSQGAAGNPRIHHGSDRFPRRLDNRFRRSHGSRRNRHPQCCYPWDPLSFWWCTSGTQSSVLRCIFGKWSSFLLP